MKNYYAIVSIAVLLSSCLFDKGDLQKAPCVQKGTVTINVRDPMSFSPSSVNAAVGDTIKWVWASGVSTHTSTSTGVPTGAAAWNSGFLSGPNSFSYVVTKAGTYNYLCLVHGTNMSGTISACE